MKRMVQVLGVFAVLVCLTSLASVASADWSDNFDSYPNGSGLHGQGGWKGWGNDPGADAFVTDILSHSAPHSATVVPTSDIVHEYSGYTSGQWVYTAWMYIPANFVGETYFILLNTYSDAGTDNNWSTQLRFDDEGFVESEFDGAQLPLITDQWAELRIEIDLDTDIQRGFYGGSQLYEKSWTDGVSGFGALNIGAVDLFGNGSDPVFWDDLSLSAAGPTPVEPASWGSIKASFK